MIVLFVEYSVTRWLYCFFNIWSFTTMKICLQSIKYMKKKVHNFVQYQIVTQEIAKNFFKFCRLGKFCKSGHTVRLH